MPPAARVLTGQPFGPPWRTRAAGRLYRLGLHRLARTVRGRPCTVCGLQARPRVLAASMPGRNSPMHLWCAATRDPATARQWTPDDIRGWLLALADHETEHDRPVHADAYRAAAGYLDPDRAWPDSLPDDLASGPKARNHDVRLL